MLYLKTIPFEKHFFKKRCKITKKKCKRYTRQYDFSEKSLDFLSPFHGKIRAKSSASKQKIVLMIFEKKLK